MRIFLATLILAISNNIYCQDYPKYSKNGKKEWSKKEWRSANTARFSFYMGRQVRQSIRFMNLARMYGEKFSQIYIDSIPNKSNYENSLIRTLTNQKAKKPLRPSPNLWGSSLIHSLYSGITNTTGHNGFKTRLAIFQPFSYGNTTGENCDYGSKKGLDIALDLLIDRGVPSFGHRKNILNSEYSRVGGARFLHPEYGWNAVFDYSSPKWIDFIFHIQPDVTQIGLNLEVSQLSNKPMLNLGIASYVNHLETTNMLWDINYQYGIFDNTTQAVSGYLGYGSSTGFATNFMLGVKVSSYFPDTKVNLYIQPTLSYFAIVSLFKKGYLYRIGDKENTALYRLSYGCNFNVMGNSNPVIFKHNITISRFISLRTKTNNNKSHTGKRK